MNKIKAGFYKSECYAHALFTIEIKKDSYNLAG